MSVGVNCLFALKWLFLLLVLLNKSTVLFFVHYDFYNLWRGVLNER